jgi:hypothetical protein
MLLYLVALRSKKQDIMRAGHGAAGMYKKAWYAAGHGAAGMCKKAWYAAEHRRRAYLQAFCIVNALFKRVQWLAESAWTMGRSLVASNWLSTARARA